MHDERLELLLNRCLDGGLSAGEAAELNALILSSPEARRQFWQAARIHSLIREWGAETWGHGDGDAKVVQFPRARWMQSRWVPAFAAAAAVLLALAGGWMWQHRAVENGGGEFTEDAAIPWVPG